MSRGLVDRVKPLTSLLAASLFAASTMTAADLLLPSAQPPGGLAVADVPQFIMIGFDDNPDAAAMAWIVDFLANVSNPAGRGQAATYDGAPVRAAFYSNGVYFAESPELVALHRRAHAAGHEIANHTQHHRQGGGFTAAEWRAEITACTQTFVEAGLPAEDIVGFRTPFLAYNAATFAALAELGVIYDTTISEGVQDDQDGTNFLWPYTLDQGSPASERVAQHPGLWEIPVHEFMVPPDAACDRLGVPVGLRQRTHDNVLRTQGWEWSMAEGKITGLDWNVVEMATLDGPDFRAILDYTLELRLASNRAPLMVGAHTALYPADKPDRREALEGFIHHALTHPEVRIVTPVQLLAWLRSPVALAH